MERIKRFFNDEKGATMVEYGLIVALIAAVCVGIVTTLGSDIKSIFSKIDNAITQ